MRKFEIKQDLKYSPDGCHVDVYKKGEIVDTEDEKFIKIFTKDLNWIKEIVEPVNGILVNVKAEKVIENKMETVTETKAQKKKKKSTKKKK